MQINTEPRSTYEHPLLTTLAMITRELWCLTDPSGREILQCSARFLDCWQLPALIRKHGLQSLDESGLQYIRPRSSLAGRLPLLGEFLKLVRSGRAAGVVSHVVVDHTDLPVGRLLLLTGIEPDGERRALPIRSERRAPNVRLESLSSREIEVLERIYEGDTNNNIARKLNISRKTVEKHRANAMKKLSVRNLAHLIRALVQAGFQGECCTNVS